MEVSLNSKKVILKSFLGWLPIALVSLMIYGSLFVFLIRWFLTNIVGFDEVLARQVGGVIGLILLAFSSYAYLNWLTNSLSSYHLSIENDALRIKGITGWSRVNTELPVNEIEKILIGQNASVAEKLSAGHGAIRDQVDSRLTFFPTKGKPFKLDFATKAFDNDSLYIFLVFAKSKGIETNV